MSLWPAVWCFLAGFVVCYGIAVHLGWGRPADAVTNITIFILLLLGTLCLAIFIPFAVVAYVREGIG